MRIITPPLKIEPEDGFAPDKLEREEFGASLLSLITKTKEEMVISLDAPWGEGKTTFVRMWQGLLTKNKVESIYFDAFANDYIDDPFIAIVSEIVGWAEKHKKPSKKKLDSFKEKALKVGIQLLPLAAKVGVKAATLNLIKEQDIDDAKDIISDIAKGSSKAVEGFVKGRIESHKNDIKTIESFRESLHQLASEVNKESNNPLVIIIDELDRCKPTYALQLIENVKHLFLVENVVFVLVMHKAQLEEIVKRIYGNNINAVSYLQKFINVECKLPKKTGHSYSPHDDYQKYVNRLYSLHGLTLESAVADDLIEMLSILAKYYDLSLRELEKCFTNISIFYATAPENSLLSSFLVAFLSAMKVKEPAIYNKLRLQAISYEELVENTSLPLQDVAEDMEMLSKGLKYFLSNSYDQDDPELRRFVVSIPIGDRVNRTDVISNHCKRIDLINIR